MSVLIKGIKMPKCCVDCPCFYDFINCQALFDGTDDFYMSGFDGYKMRLSNCPLVEVPPHGQLIDRDAIIKVLNKEKIPYNADVNYYLTIAPIIIEAEERLEE